MRLRGVHPRLIVGTVILIGYLCAANFGPHSQAAPVDGISTTTPSAIQFQSNDVVAFIGGETAVQDESHGQLESLLTAAYSTDKLRFRSFSREGDTVFEQPRDVNFPNLYEQLVGAHATVIVARFGRSESLQGAARLPAFVAAYESMCDRLSKITPRLVLVTPVPFEKPTDPAQVDPSTHNQELMLYSDAIVSLAKRRDYGCVDLASALRDRAGSKRLTFDGLHLTPEGSGHVALAAARAMGLGAAADRAGNPDANGKWPDAPVEALHEAIVTKNKLWFNYSRPTNWAFLGGDRMHVLSSRDADNPNHRWFPEEMQQYVSLIQKAELKIDELGPKAGK